MAYLYAYIAIFLAFGVIDAIWLGIIGSLLYRPTLGDILLTDLRYGPVIAFYVLFPLGILFFGTLPALKGNAAMTALMHGALFGAFAYATYDLTNYATLRNWTLQITALDISYGAIASGLAALAGYHAARLGGWTG